MTAGTRTKLAIVGAALGAMLAGEILLLVGAGFPALFRTHPAAVISRCAGVIVSLSMIPPVT